MKVPGFASVPSLSLSLSDTKIEPITDKISAISCKWNQFIVL